MTGVKNGRATAQTKGVGGNRAVGNLARGGLKKRLATKDGRAAI